VPTAPDAHGTGDVAGYRCRFQETICRSCPPNMRAHAVTRHPRSTSADVPELLRRAAYIRPRYTGLGAILLRRAERCKAPGHPVAKTVHSARTLRGGPRTHI